MMFLGGTFHKTNDKGSICNIKTRGNLIWTNLLKYEFECYNNIMKTIIYIINPNLIF